MRRRCLLFLVMTLFLTGFAACTQSTQETMQPGYYTAEAAAYDSHGWKAFLTIYVSGDTIVTIDYDAKNASGLLRSWDVNFMARMYDAMDVYPNHYTREYVNALLSRQSPDRVDAISGATYSLDSFRLLADAAIDRAKAGDKAVAYIELPDIDTYGRDAAV